MTTSSGNPVCYVRECRDHFHVCIGDDFDLRGHRYDRREDAEAACKRLNSEATTPTAKPRNKWTGN